MTFERRAAESTVGREQSPSPTIGAAPGKRTLTADLSSDAAPAPHAPAAGGPASGSASQPGISLSSLFGRGGEASPLDGGIRARAEQSLGMGLGDVRVHQGEQSSAANRELGSTAFAHGSNVVLGAGASNGVNPVMAHELAHVAQQRGAQPGVAMLSERGARGGGHEVDADHAATNIMMGAPAKISQAGAEMVMCFEGAEHMALGNAAWDNKQVTVGKVTLPAGAFTALQGDFFGSWAELEAACNNNPKLINDYYAVLVREGKLRDAHLKDPAHNAEPDSNGAIMLASQLNGRSAMDYLDLAATNFNHFSEQNEQGNKLFKTAARDNPAYAAEIGSAQSKFGNNIAQWLSMHLQAAKKAYEDGLAGKDLGGVGVAMDAAAAHYLTDSFASGHMRVPRLEMYQEYQATFRAAAHAQIDKAVGGIPDEIDLKAFINGAQSAAHDALPAWGQAAVDATTNAVNGAASYVGVPTSLPAMKISLVAMKTSIKAKLAPTADSLGDTIGEKIAGFSAKVLHDYDNEHGVHVFSDANKKGWTATGDHALAGSEENEKAAVACTAASGHHVKELNAAGKADKGKTKGESMMPFRSLKPILSQIPQIDTKTKNEGTEPGGVRDWHWNTMNASYRAKIKANALGAIQDTVKSAKDAIVHKVTEEVKAKVHEALAAYGAAAQYVENQIDAIVAKILASLPSDADILNAILATM